MKQPVQPLSVADLKRMKSEDESIIILDSRNAGAFTDGFVPGSLFIGRDGNFVEWALDLLSPSARIILIAETGKEAGTINLLAGVGQRRK